MTKSCFCNCYCGHSWYLELPSSTAESAFRLPSASTSGGHGSLVSAAPHIPTP